MKLIQHLRYGNIGEASQKKVIETLYGTSKKVSETCEELVSSGHYGDYENEINALNEAMGEFCRKIDSKKSYSERLERIEQREASVNEAKELEIDLTDIFEFFNETPDSSEEDLVFNVTAALGAYRDAVTEVKGEQTWQELQGKLDSMQGISTRDELYTALEDIEEWAEAHNIVLSSDRTEGE